jgi:hypothetical protein
MTRFGTTVFGMAVLMTALLAAGLFAPAGAQENPPATTAAPAAPPSDGAGAVSDETVRKAGAALHDVVRIRHDYSLRMQAAQNADEQRTLAEHAAQDAVRAVQRQGLSPEEYDRVIRLAQADPALRQRLLAAAGQPAH